MNLQAHHTGDRLLDALAGGDIHDSPLFRAIRDAVIVYDLRSARVLAWNPAAEDLLGYSVEEARELSFLDLVPARLIQTIRDAISAYIADPETDQRWDISVPIELPVKHKSGRELTVEFSATPVGRLADLRVLTIVRDCTERKRLAAERERLLKAAQDHAARVAELGRLKADFTAMVAHELGNPVASILAMAELLDGDGLTENQRRQICRAVGTEAKMIQRLVDDIREASRIERDDFQVAIQPVPVATILEEAALGSEGVLRDHDFSMAPVTEDVRVFADSARIGQILRNMLHNAAKYTPPGTCVMLRARRMNGHVRFEVVDDGPGIHPDDLSQILEKFGRGRDAEGNRKPGAGLGLYLSRRIAQAHGTDLRVDSAPGKGSTFAFDLEVAE